MRNKKTKNKIKREKRRKKTKEKREEEKGEEPKGKPERAFFEKDESLGQNTQEVRKEKARTQFQQEK